MATHPTALAVTTLSFPLGDGQAFHFVFSNKTEHDGLCLAVREQLIAVGVTVWQQQKNIPKDTDNWFTEWFPNAIKAVKIVCFISVDYLKSPFCMKEFRVAQTRGNLLVVACDPLDEIMKVMEEIARYPDASDALAYLMGGGQVIQHGQEDGCLQLEPGHSVITKICRSPHICSRIRKPTSRPGPWRTRTRHVEKARARTHPAAGRVTPVSLTPRGGSASRCLPAERWPTCCDLGFVPANRSPSTCSTRPPWT